MSALPPKADILRCSKERRYSITSSASESSPGGHLDVKRSRRLKVDDELELAVLSGYVRAEGRRRQ